MLKYGNNYPNVMTLGDGIRENSYYLKSIFYGRSSLPKPIADNLDGFVNDFRNTIISSSPHLMHRFLQLLATRQSKELMNFYVLCVAIGFEIYTLIYDKIINEVDLEADLYPKLKEVLYSEFLIINMSSYNQVGPEEYLKMKENLMSFVKMGVDIGRTRYEPFFPEDPLLYIEN